jgi:DNA-binding response OmpR family regulator
MDWHGPRARCHRAVTLSDVRSGNGRTPVRVEVLGPLCLLVDELPVDVRGPKRRAVLALLALAEGRTVTVDHLLDALWPAEVPESGRQALHSHVSAPTSPRPVRAREGGAARGRPCVGL